MISHDRWLQQAIIKACVIARLESHKDSLSTMSFAPQLLRMQLGRLRRKAKKNRNHMNQA